MANAIIDAITWDPKNPRISAQNLITQLELLDAEWENRLQQITQISTIDNITLITLLEQATADGEDTSSEKAQYRWFDPSVPEILGYYSNFFGKSRQLDAAEVPGKSKYYYFEFLDTNGIGTTTIYSETLYFPFDAYIIFHLPFFGRNQSLNTVFEMDIDSIAEATTINVYDNSATPSNKYYQIVCPTMIDAGSHLIELRYESPSSSVVQLPLQTLQNEDIVPNIAWLEVIYQ